MDNIKIGNAEANLSDVKKAAKMASADEFIENLPEQYFTCLEEAGNGLSGGEKQRIALARAFLKKGKIFVMDESTSGLDYKTEQVIFDKFYNELHEVTAIVIAHRLSTIKRCDRIYVLDKGKIVESGTHNDLLHKGGLYSSMWKTQHGSNI